MQMCFEPKDKLCLLRHIADVYERFNTKLGQLHDSEVFLCGMLVTIAIDKAIMDMERMCAHHMPPGKLPDRHKIAGFLSRWIAKERPIQLRKEPPRNLVTDQLQWVNAEFAVFVMASFLEGNGVSGHLGRHLKYWFAFRDERGETLSLVAYCCERMSP